MKIDICMGIISSIKNYLGFRDEERQINLDLLEIRKEIGEVNGDEKGEVEENREDPGDDWD